jgi:hypothetical protein
MNMKKIIIIAFISIALLGCPVEYAAITVSNETLKHISYTFDGNNDALAPGESKAYPVAKSKNYEEIYKAIIPLNVAVTDGHPKCVYMSRSGLDHTFLPATVITLKVKNNNSETVTIENEYLDNSLSTSLTLPGNSLPGTPPPESPEIIIYTDAPVFSAVTATGYIPVVGYTYNQQTRRMYVVIQ